VITIPEETKKHHNIKIINKCLGLRLVIKSNTKIFQAKFETANHKLKITKSTVVSKDYNKTNNIPKEILKKYHAKYSRTHATNHGLRVGLTPQKST
jgi:hypothetical protein